MITPMLHEYNINSSDPELEKDLLALFTRFCFKSEPLPVFGGKTVSQKFSSIYRYFEESFRGGLCFYEKDRYMIVFQEGQKWLDNEIPEFGGKRVAVLIMAASINKDLAEMFDCVRILRKNLPIVKEQKNFDVIAWNINRVRNKKPFERIMEMVGGERLRDCFFV